MGLHRSRADVSNQNAAQKGTNTAEPSLLAANYLSLGGDKQIANPYRSGLVGLDLSSSLLLANSVEEESDDEDEGDVAKSGNRRPTVDGSSNLLHIDDPSSQLGEEPPKMSQILMTDPDSLEDCSRVSQMHNISAQNAYELHSMSVG